MRLRRDRYRRPQFPRNASHVMFVDASGAEDGPYPIDSFVPVPDGDGAWVSWPGDAHPRMLRIVGQRKDRIETVDGTGRVQRLRMVPFDPELRRAA